MNAQVLALTTQLLGCGNELVGILALVIVEVAYESSWTTQAFFCEGHIIFLIRLQLIHQNVITIDACL